MNSLYSVFAVILPVALGLGLVYLASAGRIEAYIAIIATAAIALVLGALVAARGREGD